MITIVSWLWKQPQGRAQYNVGHVRIWADMVTRNLKMKHRLVCVTKEADLPSNVERIEPPGEFEDIQPNWGPRKPNCYRRLVMFKRDAHKIFGRRFVSMDLDCIIGGPLDPLFDRPEDFVIFKGTVPERPYNGSMMLIRAGSRPQAYEKFDQAGANVSGTTFYGSDQAWLAHILGPNEATWDESDGVWFFGQRYLAEVKRANPTILFFPGKSKPWELAPIFPYMKRNYRLTVREAA